MRLLLEKPEYTVKRGIPRTDVEYGLLQATSEKNQLSNFIGDMSLLQ
jgi:hypothetical protein